MMTARGTDPHGLRALAGGGRHGGVRPVVRFGQGGTGAGGTDAAGRGGDRYGAAARAAGAEDWPLATVRAADLADGLRARIEAEGLAVAGVATDPLLLRCNGFEVIALLSGLARRLAVSVGATGFRIAVAEEDGGAAIRLYWSGAPLAVKQLGDWLGEAVEAGGPDVTGQAVLAAHRIELWPEAAQGGYALCLPIPQARRDVGRPAPAVRAVVYDFDLLGKVRNEALAEARLEDLTYVVFDTETTGLLPAQGDEIVQIAAVRIVNGRRVAGEAVDMLVNPGRAIPAGATAVHDITDAMVADAVGVNEALRRFHAFAQGAVLVAHNAPIDMQFLRRREAGLGLRFDMPIFDTVLLSAVLYGQHDVHSLDALCHRLGIVIPDEARPTALGDTLATADALLEMLPMLRGRGHGTFGAVLAEVRRHGRLLADLNEPLG
nr:3'-5' exonuclease [Gemmobacter aquarius]